MSYSQGYSGFSRPSQYDNSTPNPQQSTPTPTQTPAPTPETPSIPETTPTETEFAKQVLVLVNEERAKKSLTPLQWDDVLAAGAQIRAEEISREFSHTRPDGSNCWSVLPKNSSVQPSGENIAAGYSSPETAVTGWMNSPGHRANIMGGSTLLGVGVYKKGGTYYWVQLFGQSK